VTLTSSPLHWELSLFFRQICWARKASPVREFSIL
jgi:hypothetical protein